MNSERINLDDFDEMITSPQLYTNCNENMELVPTKEIIMEEAKQLPVEPPKVIESVPARTSDLMEDISSRPPALPSSLDYLTEWRNSINQGRCSVGRFSLEVPPAPEQRLSLTQPEAKMQDDPFGQGRPSTQGMVLEGIAEVIADTEPESDKKAKTAAAAPPIVTAPTATTPATAPSSKGCNCKKSRCLKLYCECFAAQKNCTPECNCVDCHNTAEHEEDKQTAITRIMAKNPFSLLRRTTTESEPIVGCTCKKSSCQQNYCYCYKKGVHCNHLCKCVECENRPKVVPTIESGGRKYTKIFTSHICVNK